MSLSRGLCGEHDELKAANVIPFFRDFAIYMIENQKETPQEKQRMANSEWTAVKIKDAST